MRKFSIQAALVLALLTMASWVQAQSPNVTGRFEIDSVAEAKHAFRSLRKCESERVGIASFPSQNWAKVREVIRILGDSTARDFFLANLTDTNAAVRFYSAIGLRMLNPNVDWERTIQSVADDNVLFQNGCVMKLMSVRQALREVAS